MFIHELAWLHVFIIIITSCTACTQVHVHRCLFRVYFSAGVVTCAVQSQRTMAPTPCRLLITGIRVHVEPVVMLAVYFQAR